MLDVPDAVRRKARALGGDGERWLAGLDRLLDELADAWALEVGGTLPGGSEAYVAEATTADGAPAILKLSMPDGLEGNSTFDTELRTLRLGDGRGYVRVLRADKARRAMLQERLGRPLAVLGLPVEAQIDILADTMASGWRPLPAEVELRTGAAQAGFLRTFVRATWEATGGRCPERVIELAEACGRERSDAFDEATAVLVHGDAHPDNVLEDGAGGDGPGFRMIDPEGMRSEPAHDLAIPLRDWTEELVASDDPAALGLAWCKRLAVRTGVAPQPIWQWAFLERVSTGLFLLQLGDPAGGPFLDVAVSWAEVPLA